MTATGYPARWNAKGRFEIYTAGNRALASIENLVHRSGEGNNSLYKVMVIEIADTILIEEIQTSDLKKDWHFIDKYSYHQLLAGKWLNEQKSGVLRVPSVVIKKKCNYLINPNHPHFNKITLTDSEELDFNQRFALIFLQFAFKHFLKFFHLWPYYKLAIAFTLVTIIIILVIVFCGVKF